MFAAARCETDWEEKQVCRWDHELTSCVGVAHPFGKQQVGLVTSVGLVTPDIYISPPPHKNMMKQTPGRDGVKSTMTWTSSQGPLLQRLVSDSHVLQLKMQIV